MRSDRFCWSASQRAQLPHVTIVEDYQLQIEHALDLQGHSLALFADAAIGSPAPFTFSQIAPRADMAFTTHKLAPEAVLDIYRKVTGETPPPAFMLSVAGDDFSVGGSLSPAAAQRLELASDFLLQLLQNPSFENWQAAAKRIAAE